MSAAGLLTALQCDRGGCMCHRSANAGHGNTHCPAHEDHDPSFTISSKNGKVVFNCKGGCTQEAAARALVDKGLWHEIRDPDGNFKGWHERKGMWINPEFKTGGMDGVTSGTLYRLDEALEADPGRKVFLVEGEKTCDALWRAHCVAVGTFGAKAMPDEWVLAKLRGRVVYLWPDNDPPGQAQADVLGMKLAGQGITTRRISLSEQDLAKLPEEVRGKADAYDVLGGALDPDQYETYQEILKPIVQRAQPVDQSKLPSVWRQGLGYQARFPLVDANLTLDRLHDSKGDGLSGELTVKVNGDQTLMGNVRMTLTARNTRESMAKSLERVYEGGYPDAWLDVMERFCVEVLKIHRAGKPFTILGGEDMQVPPSRMLIRPFVWEGAPTLIFGRGGTGKSTIGGALMITAATGKEVIPGVVGTRQVNVGLLDYEDQAEDWLWQLKALCEPLGIPVPKIHYRQMSGALADQLEQIAAWVDEKEIGYLTIDSVEGACGSGDDNYNARAERLFDACRELPCSDLLIDHVAASALEDADKPVEKSIGGIRKRDRARAVYELQADPDTDGERIELVVRDAKRNRRKRQQPMGLEVLFSDFDEDGRAGAIRFRSSGVSSPTLQAASLSLPVRIERALNQTPQRPKELADQLNVKLNLVTAYLGRLQQRNKVIKLRDGRYGIQTDMFDGANYGAPSGFQEPKNGQNGHHSNGHSNGHHVQQELSEEPEESYDNMVSFPGFDPVEGLPEGEE